MPYHYDALTCRGHIGSCLPIHYVPGDGAYNAFERFSDMYDEYVIRYGMLKQLMDGVLLASA